METQWCALCRWRAWTRARRRAVDRARADGPDASTAALVERYSGNPLALKLVAETIQDVLCGRYRRFYGR